MTDRHGDGVLMQLRQMSELNSQDISSRTVLSRRRHYRPAQETEAQERTFSFSARVVICVFLFLGYCFLAKEDRVIGEYDSAKIQEVIQEDTAVEAWVQAVLGEM